MTMLDLTTPNMTSPKQKYRSRLEITIDILQICMEAGSVGILITKISRCSNLSHYVAAEKCKELIDAGLIELIKGERNIIYKITYKGINCVHEFQRFQHLVKEINIRL